MSLSILVQQLREGGVGELEAAAHLPDHTVYTFDQETPPNTAAGCAWTVLKTTRRQVVSLRFSRFQSHEVIRLERGQERVVVHPSPQLTDLVPRGGRYAYDLIAYVGQESLLHGRKLQDIAVDLVSLGIPFSSLFSNLARMLNAYLTNPQVAAAAAHFEGAWTVFQRLRDVLRFSAQGTTPLRDSYRLTASEQRRMISSLQDLREECRQRSLDEADPLQQRLNTTVSTHLDRYWEYLPSGEESFPERTTNRLERHWGESKRARRRTHGRRKLTRDFQALPEESMLVPNLDNPRYVELVLGTPENLADRLAAAGRTAGSYSAWQKRRNQTSLGRLPKRLLRKDNSLDHLLGYYDDWQQQGELNAAG